MLTKVHCLCSKAHVFVPSLRFWLPYFPIHVAMCSPGSVFILFGVLPLFASLLTPVVILSWNVAHRLITYWTLGPGQRWGERPLGVHDGATTHMPFCVYPWITTTMVLCPSAESWAASGGILWNLEPALPQSLPPLSCLCQVFGQKDEKVKYTCTGVPHNRKWS